MSRKGTIITYDKVHSAISSWLWRSRYVARRLDDEKASPRMRQNDGLGSISTPITVLVIVTDMTNDHAIVGMMRDAAQSVAAVV
jgi:hypothetical protein